MVLGLKTTINQVGAIELFLRIFLALRQRTVYVMCNISVAPSFHSQYV